MQIRWYALGAVIVLLASCSTQPNAKKEEPEKKEPAKAALPPSRVGAPDVYKVRLDTSKGPIVIEVHREWAPLGADRFYELVKERFYDQARFFRMVKGFVAQFGIAADPRVSKKWDDKLIDDDPVTRINRKGAVTFATSGPNSRTTQIFINLRGNFTLDEKGFAPFGQILEGMDVVDKLYMGYGEKPDQEQIRKRGNAYLNASFPNLDYIRTATIL